MHRVHCECMGGEEAERSEINYIFINMTIVARGRTRIILSGDNIFTYHSGTMLSSKAVLAVCTRFQPELRFFNSGFSSPTS